MGALWMVLPSWARTAVYGAVALLAIFVGLWIYGEKEYLAGEAHVKALLAASAQKVHTASLKVTEKVITEYVPKVEYIQGKIQTIIKKVPVYVTTKDDSACTIPNTFVFLWNSANSMQLPGDTLPIPSGPSDVVLSEVATQHAREAGICLANEERIRATSTWLRQQKALYERR